jgi:hypothetical protein
VTDKELAEKSFFNKELIYKVCRDERSYIEGFLDGLKVGRLKWYQVADGELPDCSHGHVVFNQDLDRVILRKGRFEFLDGALAKVIAWCEIPKYMKEVSK